MNFNLYSLWIDPVFYISVAVFVLFLFLLVYSIRRYMEIVNSEQKAESREQEMENPVDIEVLQEREMEMPVENLEQEPIADEFPRQESEVEVPVGEEAFEKTVIAHPSEMPADPAAVNEEMTENMVESATAAADSQEPIVQETPSEDLSKAEGFVKGIFNGIEDIDERLKAVESTLSERKLNGDFALRYLEDILDEYDSMDKTAVKSRIEYLIADLKK
ncbi:MAG: hypothetical protein KAI33_00860 [Elusimicrobiales bacterium]|nr:hypothetical protein [Elusimicrobiales bacterium]